MRHTHLYARQVFFRLSYEFRKRHEFRVHVPVTHGHVFRKDHKFRLTPYSTIRLRARDFNAVILDEGEVRMKYHFIEIESE